MVSTAGSSMTVRVAAAGGAGRAPGWRPRASCTGRKGRPRPEMSSAAGPAAPASAAPPAGPSPRAPSATAAPHRRAGLSAAGCGTALRMPSPSGSALSVDRCVKACSGVTSRCEAASSECAEAAHQVADLGLVLALLAMLFQAHPVQLALLGGHILLQRRLLIRKAAGIRGRWCAREFEQLGPLPAAVISSLAQSASAHRASSSGGVMGDCEMLTLVAPAASLCCLPAAQSSSSFSAVVCIGMHLTGRFACWGEARSGTRRDGPTSAASPHAQPAACAAQSVPGAAPFPGPPAHSQLPSGSP